MQLPIPIRKRTVILNAAKDLSSILAFCRRNKRSSSAFDKSRISIHESQVMNHGSKLA